MCVYIPLPGAIAHLHINYTLKYEQKRTSVFSNTFRTVFSWNFRLVCNYWWHLTWTICPYDLQRFKHRSSANHNIVFAADKFRSQARLPFTESTIAKPMSDFETFPCMSRIRQCFGGDWLEGSGLVFPGLLGVVKEVEFLWQRVPLSFFGFHLNIFLYTMSPSQTDLGSCWKPATLPYRDQQVVVEMLCT